MRGQRSSNTVPLIRGQQSSNTVPLKNRINLIWWLHAVCKNLFRFSKVFHGNVIPLGISLQESGDNSNKCLAVVSTYSSISEKHLCEMQNMFVWWSRTPGLHMQHNKKHSAIARNWYENNTIAQSVIYETFWAMRKAIARHAWKKVHACMRFKKSNSVH